MFVSLTSFWLVLLSRKHKPEPLPNAPKPKKAFQTCVRAPQCFQLAASWPRVSCVLVTSHFSRWYLLAWQVHTPHARHRPRYLTADMANIPLHRCIPFSGGFDIVRAYLVNAMFLANLLKLLKQNFSRIKFGCSMCISRHTSQGEHFDFKRVLLYSCPHYLNDGTKL